MVKNDIKNELIHFLERIDAPAQVRAELKETVATLKHPKIVIENDEQGQEKTVAFLYRLFAHHYPELMNDKNKKLVLELSAEIGLSEHSPSHKVK